MLLNKPKIAASAPGLIYILKAIANTDAEDPGIKIDICRYRATIHFGIGVQHDFLCVKVQHPVLIQLIIYTDLEGI